MYVCNMYVCMYVCKIYVYMYVCKIYVYMYVCMNSIILGDWNSIVGDESYQNIVGSHGLGRRNHRGQMLIEYRKSVV
jgi:hypothetical protein